jgi:hypothetical protein
MSLVTATKAIKHLATHPKLIEVLQHSNAVEVLVNLLGKSLIGSYSNEICANIFQAIFYMCRFSKARVEEAATAGIIPMLKRTIENKSPLKQFALPILYDLADAGKVARRLLRQNDGLKVYLNLLDEPYGRKAVLDAVVKLTDDPERTEDPLPLLTLESINGLAKCFPQSSSGEYSLILDLYVQLFRNVPGLITAASAQFLPRVSDALDKQLNPNAKLSLLRLMRILLETHPHREALVARHDFDNKVDPLTRDTSVLVRELAREVYQVIVFGYQPPPSTNSAPAPASLAPPAQSVLGTVPAKRVFSVRRPSGSRSSGSGSGGGSSSGSAANPRGARLRVPSSLSAMGTSHLANANVDLNDNSKLSPSDDADKFPSPLDSGPTSSILASAEVVSLSRSGIPRSKRHTSRKLSADLSVPRDENSNAVLGNGNGNGNGNSNGIGNGHGHAHPHGHGHGRTSSRSSRASMPWPSKSPREYALSLPDVKS